MSAVRTRAAALVAVAVTGLLQLALLVVGPSADAHATLASTTPAQGTQVDRPPATVLLRFTEDVIVGQAAVRVLDATGSRVDVGAPRYEDGADRTRVVVDLRPGLPRGSYAVVWHVLSADSHPVAGTFTFGVGVPAGTPPEARAGDGAVQTLHWLAQALWYVGLALLVGTSLAATLVLGPRATSRSSGGLHTRTQRLGSAGAAIAAGATVLAYAVQGPYGQGRELAALVEPRVLADTWATPSGPLLAVRLLLVLGAVPLLRRARHAVEPALVAVALALLTAVGGHAGQETPLALTVGADALHLVAAVTWLGGLAWVGTALLGEPEPVLRAALPRWSRVAAGAVAVLVVTGVYQAWRETRILPALTGTDYGRLLLVKVGGLAVMVALAELGRRWVASFTARRQDEQAISLRESVVLESLLGVVVLGVTAALTATVPARQAWTPPFAATLTATVTGTSQDRPAGGQDGPEITVDVDSPDVRPGVQTLHVYTWTATGGVQPFAQATLTLTPPPASPGDLRIVAPVQARFEPTGVGHGTAYPVAVAVPGPWTLALAVTTQGGTTYAATVPYVVPSP